MKLEKTDFDFNEESGCVWYNEIDNYGGDDDYTYIEAEIINPDVKWEYQPEFREGSGTMYGEGVAERAGHTIDKINVEDVTVTFFNNGDELTDEEYCNITGTSQDEIEALKDMVKKQAEQDWIDWAEDNLEYND